MWSLNFSLGSANRPELQVLKLDLVLKLFVQLMDHEVESDRSSFLLFIISRMYLSILFTCTICVVKKGFYTASDYAVYLFDMQMQESFCSSYFGDNIKAMEDEVSLSLRKTLTSFTYFWIFLLI